MSDTPRTDAVALDEREGVTHPELCETYMAWTDYWALREHAKLLERELRRMEQLYYQTHGVLEGYRKRTPELERELSWTRDELQRRAAQSVR